MKWWVSRRKGPHVQGRFIQLQQFFGANELYQLEHALHSIGNFEGSWKKLILSKCFPVSFTHHFPNVSFSFRCESFAQVVRICHRGANYTWSWIWSNYRDRKHHPQMVSFVENFHYFRKNLGWWNIIIWPDGWFAKNLQPLWHIMNWSDYIYNNRAADAEHEDTDRSCYYRSPFCANRSPKLHTPAFHIHLSNMEPEKPGLRKFQFHDEERVVFFQCIA